jgi:hypothetical protein
MLGLGAMADRFRQPLKRRTKTERLRLLRPTALRAASGLTAMLLATALLWMVLVSWPVPPSPVIRMALSAGDPVVTASTQAAAASDSRDREERLAAGPAPPEPDVEPPADAVSPEDLPTGPDDAETGLASDQPVTIGAERVSLVPAPVRTVAERGPYGPLPRIARDGREPRQVGRSTGKCWPAARRRWRSCSAAWGSMAR